MYQNIKELNQILNEIETNIIQDLKQINEIKKISELEIKYFGKKGIFIELLKKVNFFDLDIQKNLKKVIFLSKKKNITLIKEKKIFLENQILNNKLKKEKIDITLPAFKFPKGCMHPLNQTLKEIEQFFLSLGYSIHEGKEIETDLYNFEMLNMTKDHPSRDMQDSFYLKNNSEYLLRTHTSAVQIQTMLKFPNQPLKIISSGKVYRRDKDDDTHSHQFTQLEGFVIDLNISLIDLKEIISSFIEYIFGNEQKFRFRTSYFPFTKPSIEVDLIMEGPDQKKFYLEILGAGLIHPKVLSNGGFDNQKYSGFAFGMGIERITMLKYNIKNIRSFYNNDIRFLNQFV
ncbi:phenylalanine--tRNA ligase subunit alpha [Columbia Basin potato purple top phytoplasma]|uniref:Phenylalanine--tRNA ligase alpha subunit n=1 Tax=Columbia Basin potato purple top phytoplasma TaxID=307134 RepID=A0ABT5L9B0_9MOLU|nr:phenylalanine--tRNA ligase subunit alpha [Columbia Basin potato purple top phytoplasma]MDC9032189.1 phenylalanine--tRNA ligase subunit alpha [Columbia Basin potato purple top phytoplasma]